jgi:hypothetical protein
LSVAPVNEPFSWPNRIDSIRFSGMAPQLTVTNGLAGAVGRALDGARDQFLADAGFAFDQDRNVRLRGALPRRNTCFISSDLATRSSKARRLSVFFFRRVTSPDSVPILSWLRIETAMRSGLAGLTRNRWRRRAWLPRRNRCRPWRSARSPADRDGDAQLGQHFQAVHVGHDEIEQHQRDLIAARTVDQVERGPPPGAVITVMPERLIAASSRRRCTGSSSTMRMVWAIASSMLRSAS